MKKYFILFPLLFLALCAYPQFEHKMSVNLSFGSFKTFGSATGKDNYTPLQMPHYKPGIIADAGLQYNISSRLSVRVYAGIMRSWGWSYVDDEGHDWMSYEILDPDTEEFLEDGDNELDLKNYSTGLSARIYLSPGKKWNPFIFAGINYNYTRAYYADNWWYDSKLLGVLGPEDTEPYSPFLESNNGIGLRPGFGIEFKPDEKFIFSIRTGYYFINLDEENFKSADLTENFNAIFLEAGIGFNFLRSKKL